MNKFFTFLLVGLSIVIIASIFFYFFKSDESRIGDIDGITVEYEESRNREPKPIESEKDIEFIQQTFNDIKWGGVIEIEYESPPDYVLKDDEFSFLIWRTDESIINIYDQKEGRMSVIPETKQDQFLNLLEQ